MIACSYSVHFSHKFILHFLTIKFQDKYNCFQGVGVDIVTTIYFQS